MAQFMIDIADDDVERVLNSLSANYNRPLEIINPDFNPDEPPSESNPEKIDNPETLYQFGNRMVRSFLTENVKAYEIRLAKEQAAALVDTNVSIKDPAI